MVTQYSVIMYTQKWKNWNSGLILDIFLWLTHLQLILHQAQEVRCRVFLVIMGLNWLPCQMSQSRRSCYFLLSKSGCKWIISFILINLLHKSLQSKRFYSIKAVLMLRTKVRLVYVPWCFTDQHGPVELALDVCVTRATGMDKRMDGDQDETLRVEFPDLNR